MKLVYGVLAFLLEREISRLRAHRSEIRAFSAANHLMGRLKKLKPELRGVEKYFGHKNTCGIWTCMRCLEHLKDHDWSCDDDPRFVAGECNCGYTRPESELERLAREVIRLRDQMIDIPNDQANLRVVALLAFDRSVDILAAHFAEQDKGKTV